MHGNKRAYKLIFRISRSGADAFVPHQKTRANANLPMQRDYYPNFSYIRVIFCETLVLYTKLMC